VYQGSLVTRIHGLRHVSGNQCDPSLIMRTNNPEIPRVIGIWGAKEAVGGWGLDLRDRDPENPSFK
jgi:hypothetical protein